VALNFTDGEVTAPFVFPQGGACREMLHEEDNFAVTRGETRWLSIPSNYGRIWTV
jgi:maltooligosyltrehalose trehalohydrolase